MHPLFRLLQAARIPRRAVPSAPYSIEQRLPEKSTIAGGGERVQDEARLSTAILLHA